MRCWSSVEERGGSTAQDPGTDPGRLFGVGTGRHPTPLLWAAPATLGGSSPTDTMLDLIFDSLAPRQPQPGSRDSDERDLSLQRVPVRAAQGTALPSLPGHRDTKHQPARRARLQAPASCSTEMASTTQQDSREWQMRALLGPSPQTARALLSPCGGHQAALEGRKATRQAAPEMPAHGPLPAAVNVESCEGPAKLPENFN